MLAEAITARLDALEARGAALFDGPALRMVTSLLSRAEQLPAGAAERLRRRAGARLDELEQRFVHAKEIAAAEVERLSRLGFSDAARLAEDLEAGRLARVHRASLRPGAAERKELKRSVDRFASRVSSCGHAPAALLAAASRSYERRYESAVVHTAVTRELDALPSIAGRYHADSIATRAFARLEELSPAYLRARLAHLATLDAVQAFVELAPPPPKATTKGKRKRK